MTFTLTSYLYSRSSHHHESDPESPRLFENPDGNIVDRETGKFASRKEFDNQQRELNGVLF